MSKAAEIVQEMARLTVLSGRISDVQEFNLKTYPFIYFNDVEEVQINYDLSNQKSIDDEPTKNASCVVFKIKVKDYSQNNEIQKRCLALENSVRHLLWNDIKVEVFINNEIKHVSSK